MAVPHRVIDSEKIGEMNWKLLQLLPYNQDLTSSYFHLFGPQSKLFGDKFKNDEDVLQQCVRKIFTGANKNLMLLVPADVKRWEHCSELQGE